ncbi:DNA polymerase Y family protein [Olivibacter ginsenosidimutans]|uniref:DNA polymerase Y family protein n=1 Tax=Olivibacter ginsenosidimutans TaxID=1176537 RepID=A0ABP9B518_9SPHI
MTDSLAIRLPELKGKAFVLAAPERGRMVIQAVSPEALTIGIRVKMVLADARALHPALQVFDFEPERAESLLSELAEWFLRYTPVSVIDLPDGLLLDVSGCTHLWKGEESYLKTIVCRLEKRGYQVRAAMADTIAAAWAVSRFGRPGDIVAHRGQLEALLSLPPAALRLESNVAGRMQKLGLTRIGDFIGMPRSMLRRRFGQSLLERIDQALGRSAEHLEPVVPTAEYRERLPCLEPLRTRKAIEMALEKLLEGLTEQLLHGSAGLRKAVFRCYRIDGKIREIAIGTGRPSREKLHLFRLFSEKIGSIAPGLGIELFTLEAPVVEPLNAAQEKLWNDGGAHQCAEIGKLLDRIAGRVGSDAIHRYLPDEHHWPERSIKEASSLDEQPSTVWPKTAPRPVYILPIPEPITVTAPVPDYPPMVFIYKGKVHQVKKADGPERIEREWWLETGLQRDYYRVEDENGARYWLFRSGHYENGDAPEWFIHGFFA